MRSVKRVLSNHIFASELEKKDWQAFAQKFEILSVNTYTSPSRIHTFSCDEIQLTCDPYKGTVWPDLMIN